MSNVGYGVFWYNRNMEKGEAKKRIEKLREVINHHRYLYHVLDKQEISDAALDSLKHELYKLEQENPELITPDSPTQRVAGAALKEFKKVEHDFPMLSIEDIFSEEELKDWEDYLKRLEPGKELEYYAELKIDGFAISLIYKNGIFVEGSTRGNGLIGEDVTKNLKTIESIPLKLHLHGSLPSKNMEEIVKKLINGGKIEIKGEVYMEKADFNKFNEKLQKQGEKTFANPRNLAAGSIRQLDSRLAASRPLRFLAYDIPSDMGQSRHSEEHQLLPLLGFKTDPGIICKNLSEVIEFQKEIGKKREKLPFQIDGVVISVNDNSLFKKLGVIGKSPRGIRAFKFSPKQATTRVLDIKVQVGRTGALTPVAVLELVEVGGVRVSRATLHNEDEIKRLGIKIGDTVIIERAGDVIPAVANVLTELRTGKEKEFHFPKVCPVCETKLLRPEKEVIWRCPNQNCGARKRENLYHFASKKSFNIKGLGPKIIDRLMDENLISTAPEIFELEEGDLASLERFGEKSAKNIVGEIKKNKTISLAKFIYSLGIRHAGEETAINLANYFYSIDNFRKARREELDKIPDIGPAVSKSIYEWLAPAKNQKLIDGLLGVGIKILAPEKTEKKLKGEKFIFTGTLETLTREDAKEKVRLLGGEISESVSNKTDYIVVGREPGSNLGKAQKLGIKMLNEKEFLELIS